MYLAASYIFFPSLPHGQQAPNHGHPCDKTKNYLEGYSGFGDRRGKSMGLRQKAIITNRKNRAFPSLHKTLLLVTITALIHYKQCEVCQAYKSEAQERYFSKDLCIAQVAILLQPFLHLPRFWHSSYLYTVPQVPPR